MERAYFLCVAMALILIAAGCTQEGQNNGAAGPGTFTITQQPDDSKTDVGAKSTTDENGSVKPMERVSFLTSDNVKIIGNYWPGREGAVLLLHMMPSTKESWNGFAALLQKQGYSVLAIDLRGHGESTKQNGQAIDYKRFNDYDHQQSIHDVEAAAEFLVEKSGDEISIVGASIGANLALRYQSVHPEIRKAALLSAGANYRGIITGDAARELADAQQVFMAAGSKDGNTVADANAISKAMKGQSIVKSYNTELHGTSLFDRFPELQLEIISWLKD